MSHTTGKPPRRPRKSVWILLRRCSLVFGVVAGGAQATYWLLQLGHLL
ncbi:hypothetical protein ACIRD3_39510 [Kitasatospora sp. NPDC093550]